LKACARRGGKLKIIASIEEPAVIAKILSHLEKTAPEHHQAELPLGARAPPGQVSLLGWAPGRVPGQRSGGIQGAGGKPGPNMRPIPGTEGHMRKAV